MVAAALRTLGGGGGEADAGDEAAVLAETVGDGFIAARLYWPAYRLGQQVRALLLRTTHLPSLHSTQIGHCRLMHAPPRPGKSCQLSGWAPRVAPAADRG